MGAHGTAARVRIGQILISVRSTDKFKNEVVEALRRSKFKFSGRQKIYVSKKFGFTKWDREDYHRMRVTVISNPMVLTANTCQSTAPCQCGARPRCSWLVLIDSLSSLNKASTESIVGEEYKK